MNGCDIYYSIKTLKSDVNIEDNHGSIHDVCEQKFDFEIKDKDLRYF